MHSVDKPVEEKTRGEIERKLSGMGDFVKMSYLQRALKSRIDFDTRKFVSIKLAEIYEQRRMYLDAAKLVRSAGEINTTFKDKIKDFMKSVELYIKGGDFIEADRIFAQALTLGNDVEKREMKLRLKDFYLSQAKYFLSQDRRNNAKQIYEKVLTLELDVDERVLVQKILLELYQKLGNIREYHALRNKLG